MPSDRKLPTEVERTLDAFGTSAYDEGQANMKPGLPSRELQADRAAVESAILDALDRERESDAESVAMYRRARDRAAAAESRALAAEEALREVLDADDDLWSKPVGYDARSMKAARRLYAAKSRARSVLSRGTEGPGDKAEK